MKIVHVIPAAWPTIHYGGASLVAHYQCRELARRGHEVTLLTTDAFAPRSRRSLASVPNQQYITLSVPNLSNLLAFHLKAFFPIDLNGIIPSVVRAAEIVHIHDYRTALGILGWRLSSRYGIPFVLQPHGAATADYGKMPLKLAFDRFFGRKMITEAAQLISLTAKEKSDLQQAAVPSRKIALLPNGVNAPAQDMKEVRLSHRSRLGIKDEEFMVLYLGRIHPSKRLDLLLEAINSLLERGVRVSGWIVGPNDGDQEVGALVKRLQLDDDIHMIPPVEETTKWHFLEATDILVIPNFEGFPLTILESLAVGSPVITCGDKDTAMDSNVTYVEQNPEELAEAMAKFAKSRLRLSEQQVFEIRQRYAWTAVVDKLEQIYMDVS